MCDGIEGSEYLAEHFLLQCHAHSEQKRDLLGVINDVLQVQSASKLPNQAIVRTILYGDKRFIYN